METNRMFLDLMVKQPNIALMRKYTRLGLSLIVWYQTKIGDKEPIYLSALEKLIKLHGNRSALQDAEDDINELHQTVAELEEMLPPFCKFIILNNVLLMTKPRWSKPLIDIYADFKYTFFCLLSILCKGSHVPRILGWLASKKLSMKSPLILRELLGKMRTT